MNKVEDIRCEIGGRFLSLLEKLQSALYIVRCYRQESLSEPGEVQSLPRKMAGGIHHASASRDRRQHAAIRARLCHEYAAEVP